MNKQLTIEELKALKEDDWIYIKDLEFGSGFYAAVTDTYLGETAKYLNIASSNWYQEFWFEDYGTTWLAYKNKEQAEGKEDEIRKQTAKEILQQLIEWNKRETPLIADIQELAEKYNVEVEE